MEEPGWKAEANSYIHGLSAAGAIPGDVAAACRHKLERCGSSSNDELVALTGQIFWIIIVTVAATTPWVIALETAWNAGLFVVAAVVAAIWAANPARNIFQSRWGRYGWIASCAVVVPILTWFIVLIVGGHVQNFFIKQLDAERTAFLTDPQGFSLLQKLGRDQYGVDVVLADAHDSWLSVVGSTGSPASMTLGYGHCRLTMHREKVLDGYDGNRIGQADNNLWMQGIMMHEFAHCLDVSRDMRALDQQAIGTRSIAPVVAREVKDLAAHLQASASHPTQLWREAVADIFAVGYWKLTAPESVSDLVATLRRMRSVAEGTRHGTNCWIDHADREAAPPSIATVFEWADRLRASAPCELP